MAQFNTNKNKYKNKTFTKTYKADRAKIYKTFPKYQAFLLDLPSSKYVRLSINGALENKAQAPSKKTITLNGLDIK